MLINGCQTELTDFSLAGVQFSATEKIQETIERAFIKHIESWFELKTQMVNKPRFSSEAPMSIHRSVVCLPIFSNRGQTFGAVYLASKYPFSSNTLTIMTLLCQQASIGISNALLFRSVQAGTRENLKMIAAQRDALEAARKSREDALKATKAGTFLYLLVSFFLTTRLD